MAVAAVHYQVAQDLNNTLSRLRMARTVNPKHTVLPGDFHTDCEICKCTRRIDWLLDHRIPR